MKNSREIVHGAFVDGSNWQHSLRTPRSKTAIDVHPGSSSLLDRVRGRHGSLPSEFHLTRLDGPCVGRSQLRVRGGHHRGRRGPCHSGCASVYIAAHGDRRRIVEVGNGKKYPNSISSARSRPRTASLYPAAPPTSRRTSLPTCLIPTWTFWPTRMMPDRREGFCGCRSRLPRERSTSSSWYMVAKSDKTINRRSWSGCTPRGPRATRSRSRGASHRFPFRIPSEACRAKSKTTASRHAVP